ncbi:MAG TPA: hypothetical protein VGE74_14130 [Gemmata sp.]
MPLLSTDWSNNGRDPFAFLVSWSEAVAGALIAQLPADRFAVKTDCTTRAQAAEAVAPLAVGPSPTFTAPARLTDRVGTRVADARDGSVVAAVLFVTPDNKADSDSALALAVRAAGLMSGGAGVVIVDALPGPASWATHLHSLTGVFPITKRPRGTDSPVLAVQPAFPNGAEQFAVWHHNVPAGAALPTVPVAVRGVLNLALDLEATYAEACQRSKLA